MLKFIKIKVINWSDVLISFLITGAFFCSVIWTAIAHYWLIAIILSFVSGVMAAASFCIGYHNFINYKDNIARDFYMGEAEIKN